MFKKNIRLSGEELEYVDGFAPLGEDKDYPYFNSARGVIPLFGEITELSANKFLSDLFLSAEDLVESGEQRPLTVLIDSSGGDISSCVRIIAALDSLPEGVETRAFIMGEASSAAFFISLACGERYMSRWATLMWHQVVMQYDGLVITSQKRSDELKAQYDFHNKTMFSFCEERLAAIGSTWSVPLNQTGDVYFSFKDALDYKLITGPIPKGVLVRGAM